MPWRIPQVIPLPSGFVGFDPASSIPPPNFSNHERHLPHWRIPNACYFTTFRLKDSIPLPVMAEIQREAEHWRQRLTEAAMTHGGHLPPEEQAAWQEFQRVRLRKLEMLLDQAHGDCLLRAPDARRLVSDALTHFEGERCETLAFTIMPNHVHVLCRPLAEHRLEDLCGSWKWFTAQRIKPIGSSLWQEENFDRIIRDGDHYTQTVRYIAKNPVKAGLSESEAAVWFCPAICEANGWA